MTPGRAEGSPPAPTYVRGCGPARVRSDHKGFRPVLWNRWGPAHLADPFTDTRRAASRCTPGVTRLDPGYVSWPCTQGVHASVHQSQREKNQVGSEGSRASAPTYVGHGATPRDPSLGADLCWARRDPSRPEPRRRRKFAKSDLDKTRSVSDQRAFLSHAAPIDTLCSKETVVTADPTWRFCESGPRAACPRRPGRPGNAVQAQPTTHSLTLEIQKAHCGCPRQTLTPSAVVADSVHTGTLAKIAKSAAHTRTPLQA